MALLLNIDTATENASVCISNHGEILDLEESFDKKNHASFLQPSIQRLLKKNQLELQTIDAIAITNGPGSYTGLRVGLASAKGLCFAINKPLILVNTLLVMAYQQKIEYFNNHSITSSILFCPMIDARRMEVFTALYDTSYQEILSPCPLILNDLSFSELLNDNLILFSGRGHVKQKQICNHSNAIYSDSDYNASHIAYWGEIYFNRKNFANLAYSEPFYLKEFYSTQSKS